ncbi:hypothetical protein CRENBAI_006618 [Crenichthys baileyi]|uniref:Uncharacterized protein n=1 Tax=Crenichthys baileyi TaxID=28760 RepID=A0AAV9QN08_9TELE
MAGSARLPVGPVGSPLQLPGASALWLLGGSPGTLPCSSLGGLAVVLLGFLCSGGSLDVYDLDLLRICPGSRGEEFLPGPGLPEFQFQAFKPPEFLLSHCRPPDKPLHGFSCLRRQPPDHPL